MGPGVVKVYPTEMPEDQQRHCFSGALR